MKFKNFLCKIINTITFNKKKIIVMLDGGICSQMYQFAIGEFFNQQGYSIKLDITHITEGSNCDLVTGTKRYFDLKKCFPDLKMKFANKIELIIFRKLFSISSDIKDINKILSLNIKKIYLGNYYSCNDNFYSDTFLPLFNLNFDCFDQKNIETLNKIYSTSNNCGIHIRRGDLANQTIATTAGYGLVCTEQYYFNSIDLMISSGVSDFFIFSDDIPWVISNIIPYIQNKNKNYILVKHNPVEKGYLDLLLLTQCSNFITSLGSFGKYGALLSPNSNKKIITTSSFYFNIFEHCFLLDNNGVILKNK